MDRNIRRRLGELEVSSFLFSPTATSISFDRGQTREILRKTRKIFQFKATNFTVQSLMIYQYPVDLVTFIGNLLKKRNENTFTLNS